MPNIKPISDLRNYTEVLKETSEGAPVFLTKNGRGEYVILDMKDYDRMKAELALMAELGKVKNGKGRGLGVNGGSGGKL